MYTPAFTSQIYGEGLGLRLALSGTYGAYLKAQPKILAKVVTLAVRAAATTVRNDWRRQVRNKFGDKKRGKSNAFEKSIRRLDIPKRGYRLDAKSIVFSKAIYKRKDGVRREAVDLFTVFSESGTVRASGGQWLAIPTENAPKTARGRRATPKESGLPLVFLKTAEDKAVLVTKTRNTKPVVVYILRKQTHRVARLDVAASIAKGNARLPVALRTIWERENRKLEARFGAGLGTRIDLEVA